MRILQINSFSGSGGSTGRIVADLYKVFKEDGHECLVGYGRKISPEEIKAIKIGSKIDNYIHAVKTRFFDNHGFSSTKATKEFIAKMKEYNPDVVHLHNIHGYYINIELLFNYLKENKKPVIWTLHDCWPFTGHCAYFDYIGCDKWKNHCLDCIQKNSYPSSKLKDNSKLNYLRKKELFTSIDNMTIITPSKWLADIVNESFLKKYSVKVINNGIDLSVFKPTESKFREKYNLEDKFIILGVANTWEKRKGLETFIELSKRLDDNKVIFLVGLSKKQLNSLPSNIYGISRTNNVRELVQIYTAADILVNPTLEDNFPTVNLEAIACGTPVITYDTGGSPESIDEKCGIIVEKNNLENLLLSINNINKNIVFNKSDCVNKGSLYDKNVKYTEYIKLLKNIVESKKL